MKKDNLMKTLLAVLVLGMGGFVLSGCGDDDDADITDDSVSNVTVVGEDDDTEEAGEDEEADDMETVYEEDTDTEVEEDTDEDEEESEEVTAEISEDGSQEIEGAGAAEGAAITGYSYGPENGKYLFEWSTKAPSADVEIPQVEAGYTEDGYVVVRFPDLLADYVATEETTTETGPAVPDFMWRPIDGGSEYIFMTSSEKDFTLVYDEDARTVRVEITL